MSHTYRFVRRRGRVPDSRQQRRQVSSRQPVMTPPPIHMPYFWSFFPPIFLMYRAMRQSASSPPTTTTGCSSTLVPLILRFCGTSVPLIWACSLLLCLRTHKITYTYRFVSLVLRGRSDVYVTACLSYVTACLIHIALSASFSADARASCG